MGKRCLVSKGFLFIVVILRYVASNFVVICVTLTPSYFRMKSDYPPFIFCCHCLVLKQNWLKVLLSFFPFGDWQKSLCVLCKTGFWLLFQQGPLTVLTFSTTLLYRTALQVTRKESAQLLAADNILYILF